MQITIEEHPARQIVHGESVPLIEDVMMIRINGIHAGYCGVTPGSPVTMVRPYPQAVMEEVRTAVEARFGEVSSLNHPPDLTLDEEDRIDDDDDYEDGEP